MPSVVDLQNYLQHTGRQWVQYFVSDTLLFVLYANGKDIKLYRQPVVGLEQTLALFQQSCRDAAGQNKNYYPFLQAAAKIYDTLLRPLHLQPGSLIVSPDNIIIPFDALCTNMKDERMAVHDFALSYAYSARFLLTPIVYNKKAKGSLLGMAPVSFPEAMRLSTLNSSQVALQSLQSYYPDATMLYKKEATRNALLKNLSQYTIVNLYTHAMGGSDSTQPQLFFADSTLSLPELQAIRQPATQLVVLSACQTNTGKVATGEGVYTIARGFAMAGIPASIATLWNADEEATYFITGEFYKHLSQGANKDIALQKAKLAWIQQAGKKQQLPYYWANITLMGNADKIESHNKRPHFWWYAGIGFIFSIAGGWFWYQRKRKRFVVK